MRRCASAAFSSGNVAVHQRFIRPSPSSGITFASMDATMLLVRMLLRGRRSSRYDEAASPSVGKIDLSLRPPRNAI